MKLGWDLLGLELYHNSAPRWLTALGVLVGVLILLRVSRSVVARRLARFAKRTQNTVDDLLATMVQHTRLFTLFTVALLVASKFLTLPERMGKLLGAATLVVVLLQAGIWGNHLVRYLVRHYVRLDAAEADEVRVSQAALSFLGRLALWSIILILALDNLGLDITALVTGLGIGGVAIALAVQNILGDLLASLSILLDRPFSVGDFIVVGDFMGTVEHIGIKTTRARSVDGEQIVFANSDLLRSRLRNFKRLDQRRAVVSVGVTYQTEPSKLEQIPALLEGIVEGHEHARFERAHLKELGSSSLEYEMIYWIEDPDYLLFMDTRQSINLQILRRFHEEGIEFAYPTQRVLVGSPSSS